MTLASAKVDIFQKSTKSRKKDAKMVDDVETLERRNKRMERRSTEKSGVRVKDGGNKQG